LDSVLASRALSAIPDIFDRLVVTDAMILQAALITKDVVIQNSGVVPTIWD
jgi:PIN domain nuclease of toxin-antitoxin system